MKQTIILSLFVGLSLLPLEVSALVGSKKSGDKRVREDLNELGLKFSIDDDGDFRLHNEVADDRSQLIWVISNTSKLRELEVREVWSIGYKTSTPFSAKLATRLLSENCETKVGAWQMRKMGENYVAVFSAQIAADADAETLETIIDAVAQTADNLEKDLTSGDDW